MPPFDASTERPDFARYLNIRSAVSPVLAPDGSRVAYLTDVTGTFQAWSVGTRGEGKATWPRQLTFMNEKVWELHGTSADPHLIAVSDVGGNERYQFHLVTNFGVDADGHETHTVRQLTSNADAIHSFGAWSDDGQEIVYTSNARNGIDFDIYRMDLRTAAASLVHEAKGLRAAVAWSPNGRTVLSTEEVATLEVDLFALDMETGNEIRLTANRAPARYWAIQWAARGVYLITDSLHDRGALCRMDPADGSLTPILNADDEPGEGELELFTVAHDGRTAAFTLNIQGYSRLFLLDLHSGRRQQVDDFPEGVISSIRFNARGTFLVFALQTPVAPADVWTVRILDATTRQLTFSNRAGLDATTFSHPQLVSYPAHDGRSIPAFLYTPLAELPAGGFPCVLYVHGGPASQLRPELFVTFQYFLSQGFAILAPNVRGSTGYGRAYVALDDIEKRMDSVADLKAAVDWLNDHSTIDSARIAVYGRSYGGFMTLAALTEYPEAFAAGIDVVGISNWVTFLERTGPWRRAHREREYGSLTANRDFLETISPIHKVSSIRAPLLVLAGDNDPRVPISESEQIVERVRAAGGTVEFVHYADEGHIFSRLANRIDSFTQMANFLNRHLGGKE